MVRLTNLREMKKDDLIEYIKLIGDKFDVSVDDERILRVQCVDNIVIYLNNLERTLYDVEFDAKTVRTMLNELYTVVTKIKVE